MAQKAASPALFPSTSDPLERARQARAEALGDWILAGWQRRLVMYGAGLAALAGE